MKKIGELLKNKIKDLELKETDFKDIFDGILENEAENVDKDKKINDYKVKLDEAVKKNKDIDKINEDLQKKENEIIDLKKQYIDRFENGAKKEDKEKEDMSEPKNIEDLFEKTEVL